MARCKGNVVKLSGSVGGLTYKTMSDGSVCVSQKMSKKKSTRTRANMTQQLPMTNVVALARLLQDDVLDRFEGASNKVQARGRYIGLNLKGPKVYLTQQHRYAGCSVLVSQTISLGSLPPIEHRLDVDGRVVTNIRLSMDITPETTVGELSRDIMMLNPSFALGDRFVLYCFHQHVSTDQANFYVHLQRHILNLDPVSAELLPKQVDSDVLSVRDGFLCMADPLAASGAAFVHFRTLRDGRMTVSTQTLLCVNPVADYFMTAEALDAAVESRGGYTEKDVFLMPSPQASASEFDVIPSQSHFVLVRSNDESLGKVSMGRGSYIHGSEAVLTAVPCEGAWFVKWTDEHGTTVSCQSSYRLRVLADGLYTAHFEVL